MKINTIKSNYVPFKASFTYQVMPDCNDRRVQGLELGELYSRAKKDDPKTYNKIMNFLSYMQSEEGMKKLANLSPADKLDFEIAIKSNRRKETKFKFVPYISYEIGLIDDKKRLSISNYFYKNSDTFGQIGLNNPSELLDYIRGVKEGKIDILG